MSELPKGWADCQLSDIVEIGPTFDPDLIHPSGNVHFVPMAAVEAETGEIDTAVERQYNEVRTGYTSFTSGDVLFAKITPCMENGKMAIVPSLPLAAGFGSTEFHVLRPYSEISAQYIYYFVSSRTFRQTAERNMTGAVGQRRVPRKYLEDHAIPLPPSAEQQRIVAKVEELFSGLDAAEQSLTTARLQLGLYRQALLKAAFEGRLTARWRAANKDKLESPVALLQRIHTERQARHLAATEEWKTAVKAWEQAGKPGRKPTKPRKPKELSPAKPEELHELPAIPSGWAYCRFGEFISAITAGKSFACEEREPAASEIGVAKVSAVTWGEYDESESKTCRNPEMVNPEIFIKEGDFLFSRANTIELVGACVIVRQTTKNIMLSDKTLRIAFASGDPRFFLRYLRSRTGRREIEKRSTGNQMSMRNIGQDRIRDILVPLCSNTEVAAIVSLLDEQLSVLTQTETEITTNLQKIATLRQAILKRAFSGRLVPQDPADEPAATLLARLRASAPAKGKARQKSTRKASA